MKKRYIIRKYVMATSVVDAIKQEKKSAIDDCWLDEKWLEMNDKTTSDFGFNATTTGGKKNRRS